MGHTHVYVVCGRVILMYSNFLCRMFDRSWREKAWRGVPSHYEEVPLLQSNMVYFLWKVPVGPWQARFSLIYPTSSKTKLNTMTNAFSSHSLTFLLRPNHVSMYRLFCRVCMYSVWRGVSPGRLRHGASQPAKSHTESGVVIQDRIGEERCGDWQVAEALLCPLQ